MNKIFSGKKSEAFWRIINNMKNKTESEIMYRYGIKAQELEASHDALVELAQMATNIPDKNHQLYSIKIIKMVKAAKALKLAESEADNDRLNKTS